MADTEQIDYGENGAAVGAKLIFDERSTRRHRKKVERIGHATIGNKESKAPLARGWRDDRYLMVTAAQIHDKKPKFSGESRILDGAIWSLMSRSPYDIRHHLLQIEKSQRAQSVERVLEHCRHYLRAACLHENMKITPSQSDKIALRALAAWCFSDFSGSIDSQWEEFRKEARITRELFRSAFCLVETMLRHRYAEAVAQFRTVKGPDWGFRVRSGSDRYNGIYKLENRTAEMAAQFERNETRIVPRIPAVIPPRTVLPSSRMIPHENMHAPSANLCVAGTSLRAENERCT